jgi:outer membrane biosynthesis protein TonB
MKFCESCGAKIEAPPACAKCGAPLTAGVKFCESCGAPVSPAEPVAAVSPPQAAAVPAAPADETAAKPEPEKPAPVTDENPAPEPEKPAAVVKEKTVSVAEEKPAPEPEKPAAVVKEKTVSVAEEKPAPEPEKPAAVVKEKTVSIAEEKPAPEMEKTAQPPKGSTATAVAKETAPKQPMSQTTMIIAGIVVLALLGAVVYFVVLPMVSGPGSSGTATGTPAATTGSGSPVSTSDSSGGAETVSLVAGPTDALPADRTHIIDVERDAISRNIIVTFQGGNGQYGVRELVITLTRSDGTVETKTMNHLERGASITLLGSDKENRVEVTANFYNGESYKVVDKVFEYKKRMGTY